ncbi:Cation-independent mannose-6-phosphate receptor CI-MPR [Ascosphaera aggregata]|nr:Cation-independent mannose-6-phosphate receptor CI-MPR [Ascosphaera aggregata]
MQLLSFAAETPAKSPSKPCTLKSPLTGAYFDLNKISILPPEPKIGSSSSDDTEQRQGQKQRQIGGEVKPESWHARGYDYGANFTVNICAPVVEELEDVVGLDDEMKLNISAYYIKDDKVYSIGRLSTEPIFRGKRMVLNYTDGSPCSNSSSDRRKSTIISFLCDRDMIGPPATVSFVGTLDECSYFFEVRSSAACGGVAAPAEGGLSPAGVFGVIALIAIAVYLLGGCAYQRTVMHQRGWRQLPNYSLWANIASCFKDITIAILSTLGSALHLNQCVSKLCNQYPSDGSGIGYGGSFGRRTRNRERYERPGADSTGTGSGEAWSERLDVDEENRIIDQLDEVWED